MGKSWIKYFIIGTFVSLYLVVSIISTIHVVQFFDLTNPKWLSVSLAIAFELGAAASLASLIALDKMNKVLVWILFITLTAMQAMGNTYYAYINIQDFQAWSELFGLVEEDLIFQKRILSIISGAILPLVALGFIKSLVYYIKPEKEEIEEKTEAIEDVIEDKAVPQISDETVKNETVEEHTEVDNQNAIDVISISEVKDENKKEELPPVQYVNVSSTEGHTPIQSNVTEEIVSINSSRRGDPGRIPPFL